MNQINLDLHSTQDNCFMFLGKKLYIHSTFLHPDEYMFTKHSQRNQGKYLGLLADEDKLTQGGGVC